MSGATQATIRLSEGGRPVEFSFDDMLRFHGPSSPGGVAHGFQVLARALPLLGSGGLCERRAVVVRTAFAGPGARDAFELALRAVTDGRFEVDASLEQPDLGVARERFVFRVTHRDRSLMLALRDGFVSEEFIALARSDRRSPQEEEHLTVLKQQMARRVLAAAPDAVYDVAGTA